MKINCAIMSTVRKKGVRTVSILVVLRTRPAHPESREGRMRPDNLSATPKMPTAYRTMMTAVP